MKRDDDLLFSKLDATGRFHRDTPVGRIFHRGTVSFREISATDSLHIAVSPDNRVSVHVDRVSPLAVSPGSKCRYSFMRAVQHNVTSAWEGVVQICRRRSGHNKCELDCEIVSADEEAASGEVVTIYEFSCRAAGAEGCGWKARATSEEELVAKVAEHARKVHRVENLTGTLAGYARQVARRTTAR